MEVVPVEGEAYEDRQWGYRITGDDGTILAHCTTGGTGDCWNVDLLETDPNFGPLGGSGDGEAIHICGLDAFIAALIALRDSRAHREHVARWGR